MTRNAAAILAELLEAWGTPSTTAPEAHRGFKGTEDLDAWREHTRSADLIKTVDNTIIGMQAAGEDVDMFLDSLPRWYAAVHFATIPWGKTTQGNGIRPVCPKVDINMLKALGRLIDSGHPVHLTEDDRRLLLDTLQQAQELLLDDDGIPDDVRRYLHGLITRAQMVIQNLEAYGTEAVRQVALELGGALYVRADQADAANDTERAGRLRSFAKFLVGGFIGRFGERGADALAKVVEDATKALGS